MKKPYLLICLLIGISLVFVSCDKDDDITGSEREVEIYLLKTYDSDELSGAIDESSVEINEEPLIAYADILSYNSGSYSFKVTDHAVQTIENLEYSGFRMAFGVVANNKLIYTGYFWTGLSSSGCHWINIDVLLMNMNNELKVDLGYPSGLMMDSNIPDKRNDERILDIFRLDGKLID